MINLILFIIISAALCQCGGSGDMLAGTETGHPRPKAGIIQGQLDSGQSSAIKQTMKKNPLTVIIVILI